MIKEIKRELLLIIILTNNYCHEVWKCYNKLEKMIIYLIIILQPDDPGSVRIKTNNKDNKSHEQNKDNNFDKFNNDIIVGFFTSKLNKFNTSIKFSKLSTFTKSSKFSQLSSLLYQLSKVFLELTNEH